MGFLRFFLVVLEHGNLLKNLLGNGAKRGKI